MTDQEQLILDELRTAVDAAGCTLVQKGNGHYQVIGQLTVNYWPFSKLRTAHVKGSKFSHKGCDITEVIRIAKREPKENPLRPNCGACPGDGSVCSATCRLQTESPEPLNPVLPASFKEGAPWNS